MVGGGRVVGGRYALGISLDGCGATSGSGFSFFTERFVAAGSLLGGSPVIRFLGFSGAQRKEWNGSVQRSRPWW